MGKIGDMIDVGPGTPEHEVNTVKAFGSIICATPLQNDHPAGTVVAKAAKPAAPVPAPVASYGYSAPATAPAMYAPATPAYGFQVGQSINYQARSNGMWYPGRINGRSGNGWQVMLNDGLTKEVGDHEMGRLQPL